MRFIPYCFLFLLFLTGCGERQVRIHFENAARYQTLGQVDSAIAEYHRILSIDATASDAANSLGILLDQQGQHMPAIGFFRQALALEPAKTDIMFNLGSAFLAAGRADSAQVIYERIIAIEPTNSEAHNGLGAVFAAKGQIDLALELYGRALKLDSKNSGAYNNIGLLYTLQGDFQRALSYYEIAIQNRADFADAYNNLGSAYAEMDKYEVAITHFERALELRSEYPLALNNLARAKALLMEANNRRTLGEMRVRHILVATESEAHDLIAQLRSGAAFEALAGLYSLDPSRRFGGDIGGFLPGTLVPDFEKGVRNTPPGQIGGPYRTAAGYHIIERIY